MRAQWGKSLLAGGIFMSMMMGLSSAHAHESGYREVHRYYSSPYPSSPYRGATSYHGGPQYHQHDAYCGHQVRVQHGSGYGGYFSWGNRYDEYSHRGHAHGHRHGQHRERGRTVIVNHF